MLEFGQTRFNVPATAWGWPAALANRRDDVQLLIKAPDIYRFVSQQALATALAAPTQNVAYVLVKNGAAENKNEPIKTVLDQLTHLAKLAEGKAAYDKTIADASAADSFFHDAEIQNATTFISAARTCYFFQGAYMSGDQFVVGAALTKDKTARLILFFQDDQENAARRLVKFYAFSCGLTRQRLLPVRGASSKTAYATCDQFHRWKRNIEGVAKPSLGALAFLDNINANSSMWAVGGATTAIAEQGLSMDHKGNLEKEWAFVDPNNNYYWTFHIDHFLTAKGVEQRKKYVIMWMRFSGKGGGAHPELDDTWTQLAQVAHALLIAGRNVVVVGAPSANENVERQFEDGLKAFDESTSNVASRANLKIWGDYWKTDARELKDGFGKAADIRGATRAAEYAIFLRMQNVSWGCRLVHLGMRSGAMDAAALLGMPVVFIENAGNPQIERTKKWTGADNRNLLYRRASVSELPNWTPRTNKDGRVVGYDAVDGPEKGYKDEDVDKIVTRVADALR